jgi:acetyltransferase-like isoleucine patch superfamily enzyme
MLFRVRGLIRRFSHSIATELGILIYEVNARIASRTLPKFGNSPKDLVIQLPRRITNPQYIFLGDNVWLGPGTLLNAVRRYPSISVKPPENDYKVQEFNPRITIGNRVTATGNLIIGAVREVIIEMMCY